MQAVLGRVGDTVVHCAARVQHVRRALDLRLPADRYTVLVTYLEDGPPRRSRAVERVNLR
jgi:hypothetical protein